MITKNDMKKIHFPCPISHSELAFYENLLPIFVEQRVASFPKFPENELLEIFPDAKYILSSKIDDWEQELSKLFDLIKNELTSIHKITLDKTEREIRRDILKITYGKRLEQIEWQISRLKRLRFRAEGKVAKGQITDDQIQLARSVPIENLVNQRFRKSGKTLVGLCPLHNEKSPSFYIYTDENRCWCFGCNQGGDAISFIRLLNGYSFKQAVQYLINQ
jgi:hypothetical protein